MSYTVEKVGSGHQVTTPNHPRGFGKEPMSKAGARAQRVAILLRRRREARAEGKAE